MKTANNVQKTGNRNFENLISKTFVVVGFVLIGLSVSASQLAMQLQEKENNQKMTLMMVDAQNETNEFLANASIASKTFFIETSKDKNLKIENWMTDVTYFDSNMFADQISKEESLEIEDWMIENSCFAVPVITTDCETVLEVEGWMINESIWENQN